MDNERPKNQFQEVHRKVRERLARDRATNEGDALDRKQREDDANDRIFDRERPGKVSP